MSRRRRRKNGRRSTEIGLKGSFQPPPRSFGCIGPRSRKANGPGMSAQAHDIEPPPSSLSFLPDGRSGRTRKSASFASTLITALPSRRHLDRAAGHVEPKPRFWLLNRRHSGLEEHGRHAHRVGAGHRRIFGRLHDGGAGEQSGRFAETMRFTWRATLPRGSQMRNRRIWSGHNRARRRASLRRRSRRAAERRPRSRPRSRPPYGSRRRRSGERSHAPSLKETPGLTQINPPMPESATMIGSDRA